MIGSAFAGYRILSKLGGGNTGYVYHGIDPVHEREVAIKVLPNNLLMSKEKIARFNRETQAARMLSHPNIARMLAVGQEKGHSYIVMEYVEGESYTQIIERHPEGIPISQFFDLILPVLEGISYAHKRNLVHRDMKPDNIKLTAQGIPKVLDFGLVKFLDKEPSGDDSFQTMAGMVLGSAGYMSPEQADGLAFDARTDIFSIGVIMYELLAGKNPFEAPSPFATIAKILTANPLSLELLRPEVSPALGLVIHECLAKDMDQRYENGQAVYESLVQLKG